MKHFTNDINPNDPDGMYKIALLADETMHDAWRKHKESLRHDNIHIGLPKATPYYSVEQLVEMGYVGVYRIEEEPTQDTPSIT